MQESDNLKTAANPLLCDVETGLCEIPADRSGTRATAVQAAQKTFSDKQYPSGLHKHRIDRGNIAI